MTVRHPAHPRTHFTALSLRICGRHWPHTCSLIFSAFQGSSFAVVAVVKPIRRDLLPGAAGEDGAVVAQERHELLTGLLIHRARDKVAPVLRQSQWSHNQLAVFAWAQLATVGFGAG